ncbi:glycosyl transferase [Bacteroidia bacterium]|nr:glycosyl transferase [Bacteroidia bacterium]
MLANICISISYHHFQPEFCPLAQNFEFVMKPKILFMMYMPPPVHGAAMVGKYIHDSELVNKTFDCHYINLMLATDLSNVGKGSFKKLGVYICLIKQIIQEIRKIRPELCYVTVNATGGPFYKDFIIIQLLKIFKCKIVVHYHNKGVSTRQNRLLDNILYRSFFKNLMVILLAETLYQDIRKYVKRENVFICPNGIPDLSLKQQIIDKNNKIPQILFLSNLLIEKGVWVLLDACQILKRKGYIFQCNFIGKETAEINESIFTEAVETRKLSGIVHFLGGKYGEEKSFYFQNADLFVFPTHYYNECFPLVLLEAMQYQLPVISTAEGGISEIIEHGYTGFIVKKQDSEDLVEAIEKLLLNSSLRIKMGEVGYIRFKENFTLEKFEIKFVNILTQILENSNVMYKQPLRSMNI